MEKTSISTATNIALPLGSITSRIFNKVKTAIRKTSIPTATNIAPPSGSSTSRIFDKVKMAISMMKYIRIILTIFLLSWLVIMSYFMITEIIKIDRIDKRQQADSGVTGDSDNVVAAIPTDNHKDNKGHPCKHGKECPYYKTNSYYPIDKESSVTPISSSSSTVTRNTLSYENKNHKIQSLHFLHNAWFGDESIVYMLFKIWTMAVLILIGLPIVLQVLNEVGLKTNTKELIEL
jgi:hypothetical protein